MIYDYLKELITKIFLTDSPSGYFKKINEVLKQELKLLNYVVKETNKGNLFIEIPGLDNGKTVALSAHVDTLGLMVRSINADGSLSVTNVGGPTLPTLDSEYCKVVTREGVEYLATILSTSPSGHVYEDSKTKPRDLKNLKVRIDEIVKNKEDVMKLGINNGDYICIDPKTTITKSNFLKSRFIDDKGSVCAILWALKEMNDKGLKPNYKTLIYFVNQEEIGHGASTISKEVSEFVTVDMGCVGDDLAGNEYMVSIAAKDSNGPYDYELTNRLINLAKDNNINYVVDIFPFYGSDVSSAHQAGVDCKGALIGPGVDASHGMERTHFDALEGTKNLIIAYLTK